MRKSLFATAFILASFNAFMLRKCVWTLSTRRRRDCDWTTETMQSCRETQGNKEICGWQTTVCHPCKGPFVINCRSGGHSCDEAPPSKAVLLQYSTADVARRTAIALMVGWDESSIFVNWFWCGIVTVGTFYPGIFDSNWWLLGI